MSNYYLDAINPLKNIWVSASAGSGKTKVLVDRFVRLLLNGSSPESILCITFTKAAAQEMQERITDRLAALNSLDLDEIKNALLELGVKPNNKFIKKAKSLIYEIVNQPKLKILTIHSLCQEIISKFHTEADLINDFKIIDDNIKNDLINETKQSILAEIHKDPSNRLKILDHLSETSFDTLISKILSFENYCEDWSNIETEHPNFIERINNFFQIDCHSSSNLEKAKTAIKGKIHDLKNSRAKYQDVKFFEHNAFLKTSVEINDFLSCFFTANLQPKKNILLKKDRDSYPELNNLLIDIQDSLLSFLKKENALNLSQISEDLCDIKLILDKKYSELKKLNNYLDYNDLITKTVSLLQSNHNSEFIRFSISSELKHILVDESQDTSLLQWRVIFLLTEEIFNSSDSSIFVVGDDKQSIYSFQGSSPIIQEAIEQTLSKKLQEKGKSLEIINMNFSYRTHQLLLDFTDKVFDQISTNNSHSISQKYQSHISKANHDYGSIEIFPIITSSDSTNEFSGWIMPFERKNALSPAEINAEIISKKIHDLIHQGYQPSDLLILVRKRDLHSKLISDKIKKLGIPFSGIDQIKLADSLFIKDLIALGNFSLYPYDDLNLAALLKSPMFNVSEDELFELCHNREDTLIDSILKNKKYGRLKESLEYIENSDFYGLIYDFYFDLLIKKGLIQNYFCDPELKNDAEDLLKDFLHLCQEYEKNYSKSLTKFLLWISKSDLIVKKASSSSRNEIRMMTIHGSKGLQSKIVILADYVSTPKSTGNFFWDSQNNIPLYGGAHDIICDSFINAKKALNHEMINEYYRLFYVSLTRAQESLLMFGYSNSQNLPANSWSSFILPVAENMMKKIELDHLYEFNFSNNQADNFCNTIDNNLYRLESGKKIVSESIVNQESHHHDIPNKISTEPLKITEDTNQTNEYLETNIYTDKGTLIHKFLEENIGSSYKNNSQDQLNNLSKKMSIPLTEQEIHQTVAFYKIIQKRINADTQILTEQAFIRKKNNGYFRGIADLILINETNVEIIDYKFSTRDQENLFKYTEQLKSYHKSLSQIYADKIISCYIGWVTLGKIEQVI